LVNPIASIHTAIKTIMINAGVLSLSNTTKCNAEKKIHIIENR